MSLEVDDHPRAFISACLHIFKKIHNTHTVKSMMIAVDLILFHIQIMTCLIISIRVSLRHTREVILHLTMTCGALLR